MNCVYHSKNPAVVQCNGCARPLCAACDHRVRGFPFCQDCIVAGVEMLRQQSRSSSVPLVRRQSSPIIATLLSFIVPGLGAAYNGQTSKAVVHFALFASFFQMAILMDGQQGLPFFILGFTATWLFSAVDACRTAQLMRSGLAANAEEDVIARRLYGNPVAWGVTLVIIGIIFLLHTVFGIYLPIAKLLPILLVVLGGYMLFDYIQRRTKREREFASFDTHRPPPSVIGVPFEAADRFAAGEIVTQVSARDVRPFK
jgi:TM2 domain-containing membrane protein YozV